MVDFPGGPASARAVHRVGRLHCDAIVELALAGVVWMAPDHVLAGAGTARSKPDSIRGLGRQLSWPRAAALGADDARGAREVPRTYASALRRFWTASRGNR